MNAPATPQSPAAPPPPAGPAPPPAASTAMQPAQPARPIAPPPQPDEGAALNVFASAANFGVAQRMAQGLSVTTMVPEAYRRSFFEEKARQANWTPEEVKEAGNQAVGNCMIAIELASRIGCSVFMVMQNLDVIHGRPGWRAVFLIATVNASGRFTPLRPRWQGTEGKDDWGCRAVAKDRETGEECVGPLVTIALAKAEGWYARNGSKWKTLPELMLIYRSAAFWTRVFAPEMSMGMQTSEEVSDVTGSALPELPKGLTQASARALEQELMGTVPQQPAPVPATTTQAATPTAAAVPDADAPPPAAETAPAAAQQPAKATKAKDKGAPLPKGDLLPADAPAKDPRLTVLTAAEIAAGWDVSPDGERVPPAREPGVD